MNSKKTPLTLGMATALTLCIATMFASPLSATTNMSGGGMMMSSPQQPGGMSGQSGTLQPGLYASERLQVYKTIRMENLHGLFLVYGEVV